MCVSTCKKKKTKRYYSAWSPVVLLSFSCSDLYSLLASSAVGYPWVKYHTTPHLVQSVANSTWRPAWDDFPRNRAVYREVTAKRRNWTQLSCDWYVSTLSLLQILEEFVNLYSLLYWRNAITTLLLYPCQVFSVS